jgi:hypothetical protein
VHVKLTSIRRRFSGLALPVNHYLETSQYKYTQCLDLLWYENEGMVNEGMVPLAAITQLTSTDNAAALPKPRFRLIKVLYARGFVVFVLTS